MSFHRKGSKNSKNLEWLCLITNELIRNFQFACWRALQRLSGKGDRPIEALRDSAVDGRRTMWLELDYDPKDMDDAISQVARLIESLPSREGTMGGDEKILTKHPSGKSGRNIGKETYDLFRRAIESVLRNKELTHNELMDQIHKALRGKFSGNISWYAETVKLDLEARKVIERNSSKPQQYRLR